MNPKLFSDAARAGYDKGYASGLGWLGPDGDGGMGALSVEFVRDAAETAATGGPTFREFTRGDPTVEERAFAGGYITGFWEGREAALS